MIFKHRFILRVNSLRFSNTYLLQTCVYQTNTTRHYFIIPDGNRYWENKSTFLLKSVDGARPRIHHRPFNVFMSVKYAETCLFDEKTYDQLADQTLDHLNEKLEQFLDQIECKNCDISCNNGVLTLSLGEKGTYVINKQTPNKQIWLSSPISGPKRYDYSDGQWIYKHDGQSLNALLQSELEKLFNVTVDLLIKR